MFIIDYDFWEKYWENYNLKYINMNGVFKFNLEQKYVLRLIEEGKNIFLNLFVGMGKLILIKYFCI